MFAYPKQTEVNRPVPKGKIYAHAKPGKRIKELFVAQVDEILWKYKLAPETVNLPARDGVNEIQVFEIKLRTAELDPAVLHCIDKAIPFPLLFELCHETQMTFAAAYKRPSEADAAKWVVEANFQATPQSIDKPRIPLPVALDLASLYEQLLRRHMPLSARPNESLIQHIGRCAAVQSKTLLQQQLQSRLVQEKQFNRKVELNAQLRTLTAELASLQHS